MEIISKKIFTENKYRIVKKLMLTPQTERYSLKQGGLTSPSSNECFTEWLPYLSQHEITLFPAMKNKKLQRHIQLLTSFDSYIFFGVVARHTHNTILTTSILILLRYWLARLNRGLLF